MSEGKVKWGGGICVNFQYLNYVMMGVKGGGGVNWEKLHVHSHYKHV